MKSIATPSAVLFAFAILCPVGGCSDDPSSPAAVVDAGGSNDAAKPADPTVSPSDAGTSDSGSGACTDIVNAGSQVVESAGTGTKPTPAGGTLVDGIYVLTKHEVYPPSSPDANTRKRTWRFAAGKVEAVTDDAGKSPTRASGTFTTSNNEIVLTVSCPQATSVALPYTVSGSTLIMFDKTSANDIFTYTKQ